MSARIVLWVYLGTLVRVAWKNRGESRARFLWLLGSSLMQTASGFVALGRRFIVLAYAYAWFRRTDDVLDGDTRPPAGATRLSYCIQKQHLVESLKGERGLAPTLPEDVLIRYVVHASRQFGVDLVPEITSLWGLVRRDSERRHQNALVTRDELHAFAAAQDECVLNFFVKVFGGDPQRCAALSVILDGACTRIDWIRDFPVDVRSGAVNIAREAAREFGIEVCRLRRCVNWEELWAVPGFRDWYREEILTLIARWEAARSMLGVDFGGIFFAHRVARLLWRSFMAEFDQSFRVCTMVLEGGRVPIAQARH